jgi:hypothetical protein
VVGRDIRLGRVGLLQKLLDRHLQAVKMLLKVFDTVT